ncbi:hypothetical protein EV687_1094 [Corticibacter populi]|nr:hypothetical protein EV687_1094 [Corticibacter populi]
MATENLFTIFPRVTREVKNEVGKRSAAARTGCLRKAGNAAHEKSMNRF